MNTPIFYLLLVVMAAVVAVLAVGIGRFGRGGEKAGQRSNQMMQLRILLQAVAVALILLVAWLGGMRG